MDTSKTPFSDMFSDNAMKVLAEYQEIVDKYQDKFGKDSLDRVILPDPFDTTLGGYLGITAELNEAIENNIPLEQIPQEVWDSIVF